MAVAMVVITWRIGAKWFDSEFDILSFSSSRWQYDTIVSTVSTVASL